MNFMKRGIVILCFITSLDNCNAMKRQRGEEPDDNRPKKIRKKNTPSIKLQGYDAIVGSYVEISFDLIKSSNILKDMVLMSSNNLGQPIYLGNISQITLEIIAKALALCAVCLNEYDNDSPQSLINFNNFIGSLDNQTTIALKQAAKDLDIPILTTFMSSQN